MPAPLKFEAEFSIEPEDLDNFYLEHEDVLIEELGQEIADHCDAYDVTVVRRK
jgi:hypothetical protein